MKIIIIAVLSFCFVTIQAQDNISVSIEKTFVDNKALAIRTTITNNNIESIVIPIESSTDDYGNNINGGSTYLSLNVYDKKNNKVSIESNNLYYQYNPDYPLLNNENRIILKKGQSITKTDRVIYSEGIRGFLNKDCTYDFFEVKLHIKFFYLSNDRWYIKDLVSNRVSFN